MTETPLAFESISALAARLREGAVSPVALAEAALDRVRALDRRLHAFIAVTADRALAEARAAESALRGGQDLGPLHGIPYAAKDLFDVRGVATTAGTRLRAGSIAAEDAAVVRRLAGAGMVLLGKTHTVQFAFGGATENRFLPHNYERNGVVYTGTHDNDTTWGWYQSISENERDLMRRYTGRDGGHSRGGRDYCRERPKRAVGR